MTSTMMDRWDVENVKRELPEVSVKMCDGPGGPVLAGRVLGRKNVFATVVVKMGSGRYTAEFAWETIARHLNADPQRPLIMG